MLEGGKTMRIGVIGTGQIAHDNVRALLKTGRAEIAALCNRTREKAEAFADEYSLQVPVYTDYREMLACERLDAALINTPHEQHCRQFLDCCEAGLSIMVEKPLATSSADGLRMLRAAREAGVRAAVCHTQRYLAPMMALRAFLSGEEGRALGRLRHASDTINLNYFHDQRPAWFFDPAQAGGGLLMTHGAHQIDRMHFLIGQPTDTLYAHLEPMTAYSGLDGGSQLMGRCGEVTYLAQCAGYYLPQESALELTFERGSIRFSWKDNGVDRVGVWLGDGGQAYASLPCPFDMEYTYVYQFDAMLDALEGKKSDAPTLEQATEVLLVLEAIRQSSDSGMAARVETIPVD